MIRGLIWWLGRRGGWRFERVGVEVGWMGMGGNQGEIASSVGNHVA